MVTLSDPYQTPDAAARLQAQDLLVQAKFAALAFLRPDTGLPSVSRIALATDEAGCPVSLISTLAEHTRALSTCPNCALLIGEPADKGDPLTHPRLTLHVIAQPVHRDLAGYGDLRDRYLARRPKAKLYIDFADFGLVRFAIQDGLLNAGFGKAYRLTAQDF
ncbi:pyridoxamine 5-phosphate oxidase [Ruegeria sp. HKCCD6604]|nr:pyridoxamine 5-phosphate oxidase [Ruegeria sp. HKCCD6604]